MADEFGDIEDDDLVGIAPADPEAVLRIFFTEQRAVALSRGADDRLTFDELHPWEQALLVYAMFSTLQRMRQEGAT